MEENSSRNGKLNYNNETGYSIISCISLLFELYCPDSYERWYSVRLFHYLDEGSHILLIPFGNLF